MLWIIVTGSFAGLSFVGPFPSREQAAAYASLNENEDVERVWDIVFLNPPVPDRPHQNEA